MSHSSGFKVLSDLGQLGTSMALVPAFRRELTAAIRVDSEYASIAEHGGELILCCGKVLSYAARSIAKAVLFCFAWFRGSVFAISEPSLEAQ